MKHTHTHSPAHIHTQTHLPNPHSLSLHRHIHVTRVRQEAGHDDAEAGVSEAPSQLDGEVCGGMAAAQGKALRRQAILLTADAMVITICKAPFFFFF